MSIVHKIAFTALVIAAVIATVYVGSRDPNQARLKELSKDKPTAVTYFQHKGHSYINFRFDDQPNAVVHDPDCKLEH